MTGPLPDILTVIEDLAGVPVAILSLPDGIAGAFGRRRKESFIFLNGAEPLVRQRFTLAHEFGHDRLGHSPVVDRTESIFGPTNNLDEIQAKYFAGELLLPKPAAESWLDREQPTQIDLEVIVRLASAFGVSAQTVRVRLEVCQRISKTQISVLDAEIAAGAHLRLQRRLGLGPEETSDRLAQARTHLPRLPSVMHEYGFRALELGFVDVERLADSLGRDVAWVERRMADLSIEFPEDEPDF
ncbi:MAG: ImmA/IrrE family metallo-endopeptidase [Gaiellaceae bacterium]